MEPLKTYQQCLDWMAEVEAYKRSAPEGCYMTSKDRIPTLRKVDPKAITQFYETYFHLPYRGKRAPWVLILEGGEEGAFYSLTLKQNTLHEKLSGVAYKFFYRPETVHEHPLPKPTLF